MIKDKIKQPKPITDETTISHKNDSDLDQCPYCRMLFGKGTKHQCKERGWFRFSCTICNIQLDDDSKRRRKTSIIHGHKYTSLRSKKYFTLVSSIICWNCAFKLTKMFVADTKKKDLSR